MFENIRQDLNKRFDKIGEGVLPGRAKSGTYEERLSRARSGGGASGTQASSLGIGEHKPRNLPPPLPGRSDGVSPAHDAVSIPPPPPHMSGPHLPARSVRAEQTCNSRAFPKATSRSSSGFWMTILPTGHSGTSLLTLDAVDVLST